MADVSNKIATLIDGLNLSDEQIALLTKNLATMQNNALLAIDADVAKAKEGTRVTKRGFDLMAKAIAGKELHYTRVAFGDSTVDGEFVDVSPEEGVLLDDLIHWRMNLPMADCSFTGAGTVTIRFAVQNAEITEGFYVREIGLFAEDPDTGEEILYCYRNSGILSSYIPAGGGSVVWNMIMSLITVVDSATNVTAVIDGNLAFVSQTELLDHINSTNPHPNIPNLGDDVTSTTHIWCTQSDNNLHKIHLDNLRLLILGGDASDLPKIDRRLSQVENNLANLYMQLNAEAELGLKANLMLVEDFGNYDCCDMYRCRVLGQVAGVNGFRLESDQGILSGHWYTITDGINSEYLRVRSVAKNSDENVVILENNLVHTYNLDNTYFIRSSALITQNHCVGAGDMRSTAITFSETWQGSAGNVGTVLPLETTQSKVSNFTITGDGAFNSNGEFTLVA